MVALDVLDLDASMGLEQENSNAAANISAADGRCSSTILSGYAVVVLMKLFRSSLSIPSLFTVHYQSFHSHGHCLCHGLV